MENASKALIIAGAILISILLISVGIIVMNAINNPVQQGASAADSQAVEIFNGKFTGYGGAHQKGTTIKALYTATHSTRRPDGTEITWDGPEMPDIESNAEYSVGFSYDAEGYIESVNVN